jgi:hypothetical protein
MLYKMKFIFIFLLFPFLFYYCASSSDSRQNVRYINKSNNKYDMNNYNKFKEIIIKVISGNVSLNISGYTVSENKNTNTINKTIALQENNEFKYNMIMNEIVILNVRSIDNNDAKILVSEYDNTGYTVYGNNKLIVSKEYIIYGSNNMGKMISISNVYMYSN